LVIAAAVALLVVSGAMLFGMGKPAQAQSDPELERKHRYVWAAYLLPERAFYANHRGDPDGVW